MNKDIQKFNEWRKMHKKLLSFVQRKELATGDQIRDWFAECVVYFTEINIGQSILEYFISGLKHWTREIKKNKDYLSARITMPAGLTAFNDEKIIEYDTGLGPWPFDPNAKGYVINNCKKSDKSIDKTQTTFIKVAFKVAENLLKRYENQERIVQKSLINEFEKAEKSSISISLKEIQRSYEKRDPTNMLKALITTTDSVLKLIPELSKLNKLNKKLLKIYSEKTLREKYGINPEIIWSLNNSRIIRNQDSHEPLELNNTTLFEAVGYTHILILFINSILASGNLKL